MAAIMRPLTPPFGPAEPRRLQPLQHVRPWLAIERNPYPGTDNTGRQVIIPAILQNVCNIVKLARVLLILALVRLLLALLVLIRLNVRPCLLIHNTIDLDLFWLIL
jgi:hypothetical protein